LPTPHFSAPGVTIYHGDALDVLRQLPDGSVGAVITDPPYGIDFQSNMRSKRLPKMPMTSAPSSGSSTMRIA
jgi:tRNA G10  N-methylase Trm11